MAYIKSENFNGVNITYWRIDSSKQEAQEVFEDVNGEQTIVMRLKYIVFYKGYVSRQAFLDGEGALTRKKIEVIIPFDYVISNTTPFEHIYEVSKVDFFEDAVYSE